MSENIETSLNNPAFAVVPGEKLQAQVPAEDKQAKKQSGEPNKAPQEGDEHQAKAKPASEALSDSKAPGDPKQSRIPEKTG